MSSTGRFPANHSLRRGRRYGLPGTAAEIHYHKDLGQQVLGYGLPGTAAEIHYRREHQMRALAMVCREPLLRYTLRR